MTPLVEQYVHDAADRHGVHPKEVLRRYGSRSAIAARCEVWERLRLGGYSLKRIGRMTGFHHTTVLYGLMKEAPQASAPRTRVVAAPAPSPAIAAAIEAMQLKHQRELAQRY